jgi:hypothetical protein
MNVLAKVRGATQKRLAIGAICKASQTTSRQLNEACVFVKHRDRIAHRAAHGADTLRLNGRGLQLVQLFFGKRKVHPTQGVEKIMQAIARGYALSVMNELLVGLTFWQFRLGHKVHRATQARTAGLLERSQGVIARLK